MRTVPIECVLFDWVAPLVAIALAVVGLQGCSGDCDENVIHRAVTFLDANQSCQTDQDCTVVSTAQCASSQVSTARREPRM